MPDKVPVFPYTDDCRTADPPHKADRHGKSCATCRCSAASKKAALRGATELSHWADEVCDALMMWCHDPQSLKEDYLIGLIERRP